MTDTRKIQVDQFRRKFFFFSLFENEKAKLEKEYNRLQMGIVKVAETRAKVGEISVELEKKKILVGQLQRECEEFLGKIVEEKTSASERERVSLFFDIAHR